jgi:Domain of unknown function (DUF4783)
MAYFSFKGSRLLKITMQKLLLCLSIALVFSIMAFKPVFHIGEKEVVKVSTISGLDDVINALKTGNAKELSKYVDDNIVINLPERSDSYSRAQAIMVLQDFFTNNGVKGFELQFKGENGGSQFCIGKLITRSGSYRTTVFMKTNDGKQLVKEIRFQSM